MIIQSDLLKYLQSRVLDMNSLLLKAGYPKLDRKELMAKNGWKKLPEELQRPIFMRDAFQQVANFVEHSVNPMETPGCTNEHKLHYLATEFTGRYLEWLSKNQEKFDVKVFVDLIEAKKDKLKQGEVPQEEQMFFSLTAILLHNYATSNNTTPEVPPEAA